MTSKVDTSTLHVTLPIVIAAVWHFPILIMSQDTQQYNPPSVWRAYNLHTMRFTSEYRLRMTGNDNYIARS